MICLLFLWSGSYPRQVTGIRGYLEFLLRITGYRLDLNLTDVPNHQKSVRKNQGALNFLSTRPFFNLGL
jgi:hypothetical protein